MTETGGMELPGEVAGLVALDELVIHGWDLARALDADPASLQAVHTFLGSFAAPRSQEDGRGPFGPVVEVPDDAPLLARVIGPRCWPAS